MVVSQVDGLYIPLRFGTPAQGLMVRWRYRVAGCVVRNRKDAAFWRRFMLLEVQSTLQVFCRFRRIKVVIF